ncbi:MAG TPA: nitroreductase family protein [Candidatus Polarisedimenticolia bacterium]|nr:nitroreductase family protein [Candidatus Polarisedimenticolia bacterium]
MSGPRLVRLPFERLDPAEQIRRARAFYEAVAPRRSVRHFDPRPVAPEALEWAVRAAGTAPSGANLQPWRFVVVSDPAVKRAIREAAEEEERRNYESRFPQEWKDRLEPLGTGWRKEFLEVAPHLIAVFAVVRPGGDAGEARRHYYVSESVGIACGVLLTALHLAGLATLTHTPSPMGFLGRILRRPSNERPYLLIPVGYPAPDAEVPDIGRKPLGEILVKVAAPEG